ncbi:hypothetical protein GCM10007415_45300 [Parapedobacter pyrenivorans]|uniref:PIN domain-containing protein n=1 Tax=Parapedobacter pyrenivorans TaxID=1305674 RepID=A0A917I261_9SPHI|nr:type II toxin-antitoxin system VapC family toxin [Parapedobacter pyrenivorans]GGH04039.1 hypothetical protein GCM10007415_45300 [Parapedobacter pyrenivorans]
MGFLIDSNIIIYSLSEDFQYLRALLVEDSCHVSEISRVEVLGYHGLKNVHKKYFLDVFSYVSIIAPDNAIFDKAIDIRQQYNLKLGDSVIASTAIIHHLDLYTRNLKDFERIAEINCINPIV